MSSLLDESVPLDSLGATELSSEVVNRICSHTDEGVAKQETERFIQLLKKYVESLPSSSLSSAVPSSDDIEDLESLLDVIWVTDMVHADQVTESQDAAVPRAALANLVKELEASTLLSADLLKQRLDHRLLQQAGLITPAQQASWPKSEARVKTGMLYKQQKFNLLREESEGYSKLEVELLSNMGNPHDSKTAQPAEPLSITRQRAERTMTNIKAIIGYFDLDPSRALDVILDVFTDNVIYHHVFFRELLKVSPWGIPADQAQSDNDSVGKTPALVPDGAFDKLKAGISTICSQIIGFKFSWFASPEGAGEIPSEKLYLMTAILIKDGLVDLPNLWPHLYPQDDEEMKKLKETFSESISDRIAAARSNALSMAGMLADDGPPLPPGRAKLESTGSVSIMGVASGAAAAGNSPAPAVPKEPVNTRIGLLRALLSIGAIRPAFFILSLYPWICDSYPDITDLLVRISNHSISDYFASNAMPVSLRKDRVTEKLGALRQARPRYSAAEKKVLPASSPVSYISGRPFETGRTHQGTTKIPVYFFSEWTRDLTNCTTAEDVLTFLEQMLKLIGVHAGRNSQFFSRLLRITRMETVLPNEQRTRWEAIIRMHLIPALSLSEPNPALSMEFWDVLRNFPYTTRFAFYGEWKDRLYKRLPELRVRRAEADRDAKGLLKRLSVDNVKQFGRSLAKIAHTNPCVLFEIALTQVQSYDNLIGPVVESARYFTHLGYDVLGYSLLDALSNPAKERTKSDGTNISLWLQGLATFAGTLCKRWAMDVGVILQYILNQLRDGNPKDLVVLRELISKMANIEPVSDLSDSQVTALGGGRTLQTEALHPTTAVEKKSATKRSTARLRLALTEAKLTVPLLVAVALQRQDCVFGDEEAPLKYLGNLFDQCQQVLFQYLDFLLIQLGSDQFSEMMPGVGELWDTYGIDASIAFQIVRPGLQRAVQQHDTAVKKAAAAAAKQAKEDANNAKSENHANGVVVKEEDVEMKVVDTGTPEDQTAKGPWHPALGTSIEIAKQKLPPAISDYITPGFFVTFWQLSLYDVLIPMQRYQIEVDRLNAIIRELDTSLKSSIPSYPGQVVDRAGEADKRKARERCMLTVQCLNADLKAHTEAYEGTRKRLQVEKVHWFVPEMSSLKITKEQSAARRLLVSHFMQECINPRARLSPVDASYCARFIRILHNVGTPNFPSLHVYDRIFSEELSSITFHCTEGEARNYARFLHDCLADLRIWYDDEAIYKKQAIGTNLPGFLRTWSNRVADEPVVEKDCLKYSEYKMITNKWHKKALEAFTASIVSRDYMCIRNTILILTKIARYFPYLDAHGAALQDTITQLIASEKREDLKVLALGYSALLKKQSATWLSSAAPSSTTSANTATASRTASPAVQQSPAPKPAAAASSLAPPSAPGKGSTSPLPASGTVEVAGNASPAGPRPTGLPAKPSQETDRTNTETLPSAASTAARSSDSRRVVDHSTPSAPRASHALPPKPSLDGRREPGRGNTSNGHAVHPPEARGQTSQHTTPLVSRGDDAMDIDEPLPTRAIRDSGRERDRDRDRERERPRERDARRGDEFAIPARPHSPAESKASGSRAPSPSSREAASPRTSRRDEPTPKDERRGRLDDTPRTRQGSEESSHSQRQDREKRDRDRADRTRDREARSDRDRTERNKERSTRDGERQHRSERADRDKDRDSRSDRHDRERDRDTGRSSRDKERDRRREKDRERERDKDKEKETDRESRRDRDKDRESGSGRRSGSDRDRRSTRRDDKDRGDKDREKRPVEDGKTTPNPSAARDLKRPAEAGQPQSVTVPKDGKNTETVKDDDHDAKRRRIAEPAPSGQPPTGPRADRLPPAPESSAPPSRPATSTTSIKGRAEASRAAASPTSSGAQGFRIRSAAAAASLNSAQQHNARIDTGPGPRGGSAHAESPQPQTPPVATGRREDAGGAPSQEPDTRPLSRGLADRLGPSRRNSGDDAHIRRGNSDDRRRGRR